jgi:DNA-binding winged helix-turn-helix (wHTH) protein/tetratricopeptide (TPR) repeat protein
MYQFGEFRVDPSSRALMRNDNPIALNRRAFDVLLYLVENPGRVVTKEELLKSVWPDAYVDENNLTQSISSLRKALEERPGANTCITTLPGRGYQFIASVSRVGVPEMPLESRSVMGVAGNSFVLQQRTLTTSVVTEERRPRLLSTSVLGWIVVIALLAGVGAYEWKRHVIPSQLHKVVVADFANNTGDLTFDRTLRRALEIDLSQSPYLDVMSEQEGINTLGLMGHKSDDAITAEVARDICVRTGRQVVLTGSITGVGHEYLLTLEATDCNSARKLVGAKAEAATKEKILASLDSMAESVRKKLGESAASVANFEVPIQAATTPSLEALKAYSLGQHMEALGKEGSEILPFYQQAVELDPQFSMAYAAMGGQYYNLSESDLASQNLQKAFDLSVHGNAREKLSIESHYYAYGVNDLQRGIQTYQLWTATYPQDWVPWQNLANDYNELDLPTEAIVAGEHALQMEQNRGNIYNVLIRAYKNAGRYKDAQRLGQEAVRRGLDSDAIHAFLFEAALDAHDADALERETRWGGAHGGWFFLDVRAKTEASVGKIRQSNASFESSREMAVRENLDETADDILIDQAQAQYDIGMTGTARATMARITKSYPDAPDLALLHAELGDSSYAERFLAAHKDEISNTLLATSYLPQLRAALALTQREPIEAVVALEPARLYGQKNYDVLTERATAYMQEGKADLAANEYKTILAAASGADANAPLYNLAHVGLARAYAAQGKKEESHEEYAKFLELWKDADADAPVLKQAEMGYSHLPK